MVTRALVLVPAVLGGIVAAAAAVPTGYVAALTVVGTGSSRPGRRERRRPGSHRFAVMVPAHDEAAGIGATLVSCREIDYPADRFSVHVVADNCTDATAEVVRTHGWTAHERAAPDDPGKGPALNWLYERLVASGEPFDAVVIVDADTSIDPGFLAAMSGALDDGAVVAQGFYSVREPEASPVASLRFAALACRHHLRAAARTRLGASCGLYGNGMTFRRDVPASHPWSGHLVEDAELQNELLFDGILVRYVPDAVVRAEMPTTTEQATTQNERWERGRIELARRYATRHLSRAVLGGAAPRRAHLDAALDHLTPPISVLVGMHAVAGAAALPAVAVRRTRGSLAIVLAGALGLGTIAAHVVAGLRSVGASRAHDASLASAPRVVAWKIRLWLGVLTRRDVAWTRTARAAEGGS